MTAFLLSRPSLSLASPSFHSAKVFFLRIAKNRLGTRLALPHFLPLHSPSTRGTTKRNGVSSSTSTATSLPDAKPTKLQHSQAAWCTAYVSTEQHLPGINCNRGRPTGGDQRHWRLKKNDRDRSTFITGNSLRVHSSRVSIPGKFGYQPIKLELCPLVHTHTANYVGVHLRYLGVYKESRVAYRAIRVRVS